MLLINHLSFRYQKQLSDVINIEQLQVNAAQSTFLHGPSGSGKSTLLALIAGLQTPKSGHISILGHDLTVLSSKQSDQFRADHIGFIFQNFNLVPYLSAIENVTLGCLFSNKRKQRAINDAGTLKACAIGLLNQLGVSEVHHQLQVNQLSQGQQQRIAAARALIGSPELIIADEPTSSLDCVASEQFMALLFEQIAQSKSTLLFVSHDLALASRFDQQIHLSEINQQVSP